MTKPEKLHILVTGAASGIGAACARKLANRNHVLFLHTGKNQEKLERLAQKLRTESGAKICCYTSDFNHPSRLVEMVAEIKGEAGHIDQLVLNAGYADKGDFRQLSSEKLRASLAVIAESPALLIKAFIQDIQNSQSGRIVAISSFVNKAIGVNDTAFTITTAAKSALEGLTMEAARQFRKSQATANIISPGYTRKDSKKSAFSEQQWRELADKLPLGRLVEPDEVAGLVQFLLSEQAAMITGQNISIDSGLSLL